MKLVFLRKTTRVWAALSGGFSQEASGDTMNFTNINLIICYWSSFSNRSLWLVWVYVVYINVHSLQHVWSIL